ncbi:hypothetical protein [Pseudomarimonas salicorniae]|uniref:Delta-60 repeat domain-containing protein n=1 Tax=Pseudomarimonas salicorniae TaxID=2933270 RepID=A0ABT0GDE6_9GAMM|nr:hypothetical protein [Lysobacter sp. CAU 1642]MCK7592050.1 hypothetical protein [Lysobacter sp. CAU 1642]
MRPTRDSAPTLAGLSQGLTLISAALMVQPDRARPASPANAAPPSLPEAERPRPRRGFRLRRVGGYPLLGCLLAALVSLPVGHAGAAPGDLDLSFGEGGILYVGRGGTAERINSLLADANGAVFAGGALQIPSGGAGSGDDMSVLRLLGDGQLDPAFANGGLLQVGLGGDSEYVTAMVRQPDGRIVAVGALEPSANTDFGVIRFDEAGRLDEAFGDADPARPGLRRGLTHFNMGPNNSSNDEARAVALQSDGRIIVAGTGFAVDGNFTYPRFAIARLTADGRLDASFGNAGRVIAAPTQAQVSEYVTAIALDADGQLSGDDGFVVVGYVFARSTAIVRRYLADGQPDLSFGSAGQVVLVDANSGGVRSGLSRIDDAVLQPDGGIVLLGRGGDRGFAFLRLHADGSLDTDFGSHGRTLVKFSSSTDHDEPAMLRLQRDGKLVAAGYATGRIGNVSGSDFASVRLLANGRIDSGYGDGSGRSTYPLVEGADEARAVAVLSDGSLLLAGYADRVPGAGRDDDAAFLRLQGDPGLFANGFEDF